MTTEQTEAVPQSVKGCPDTGACGHYCKTTCYRVANCGPLSIAGYPNDQWPHEVLAEHAPDRIPEWEVFLVDDDGFTERDDDKALGILALIDDEEKIWAEYGDCIPEAITVCRGDAKPQPQSPGDDHLRQPGTRNTADFIDFDISGVEDPTTARLMWVAAKGAAKALNDHGREHG